MSLMILALAPRLCWNRIFHGRFLDVLVTHAPPAGIHDKDDPCHRGFASFLWFMRLFKPRYLIHGHIHLYDLNDVRSTKYGRTMVINAYGHFHMYGKTVMNERLHSSAPRPRGLLQGPRQAFHSGSSISGRRKTAPSFHDREADPETKNEPTGHEAGPITDRRQRGPLPGFQQVFPSEAKHLRSAGTVDTPT
jgi:hypothetical protein